MNKIDHRLLSSGNGTPSPAAGLADFNVSKKPKEREAASKLLTLVAIKLAERDPATAIGKMKSPTEYMETAYAYFRTRYPSRPFAFLKSPESYYRKELVPDFVSVASERFIRPPKQKFMLAITGVARDYYLGVLIATVISETSEHGEHEALAELNGYINFAETTRDKLAVYLGRSAMDGAIAEAKVACPRVYQLLVGWKELFGA